MDTSRPLYPAALMRNNTRDCHFEAAANVERALRPRPPRGSNENPDDRLYAYYGRRHRAITVAWLIGKSAWSKCTARIRDPTHGASIFRESSRRERAEWTGG